MAKSENWSLKHVAYVIHEEENQQAWSKMHSLKVFARESQESSKRALSEPSPSRSER